MKLNTVQLTTRVSKTVLQRLERIAGELGIRNSEYLRYIILRELERVESFERETAKEESSES